MSSRLDLLTFTDDEPEPEDRVLPDDYECPRCGGWKPSGVDVCDSCDSQYGEPTDD